MRALLDNLPHPPEESTSRKRKLAAILHADVVGFSRLMGEDEAGTHRALGELRRAVDPLIAAQKKFHRMGMHKTRERNAVLILVAPRSHKFAVIGDEAIHEKCGEEFWQRLVDAMRAHFQNEKFSHALVEAIEEIGKVLAAHFPKTRAAGNELSDEIVEKGKAD